jgi:histidinol-phosphatase (PHP family)
VIDLHVHTWRCRHATGDVADYVDAAVRTGVKIIAFTEHLPLAPAICAAVPGAESYAMPADELNAYVAEVQSAAAGAAKRGVEVLLGAEADLVPVGLEHARALLGRYPFDVVLGSIHMIDDWAFDDPDRTDGYGRWKIDDLWERYFADLAEAARSGLADVIAHVDLIKKFRHVPPGPLEPLYAEAARAIAGAGVAVEVNTAGLRKPCAELYPAPALLAALNRAGVPVTVGSDAHSPSEVGAGREQAIEALRAAGYRSVLVFRQRIAEEVGLDAL